MVTELRRSGESPKNRPPEGDMFDRTRKKLTLQYSGMLIAFLGLFVIIVYATLYAFIWNDQYRRLDSLADREIGAVQDWADRDANPSRPPPRSVEDAFFLSADQSFYYLIAANGELQLGDEIQPELRDQVMAAIAAGGLPVKGVGKAALRVADRSGKANFIVTGRNLQVNGERLATLYIGKDVSFQQRLFRWLLILLPGMALLFFALAAWFSQLMARKAMIPIAGAYDRQREFVADASHELRTPLSVMLASIEALRLEDSAAADPFARKVLGGLKHEVNAMTKLAENLLQLARSDSGEWPWDRSLFDARAAADRVIDKLRPLADAKAIALALDAPAEMPIAGDEEKLSQLFVLLMDNAIKYTADHGAVRVRLREEKDRGSRFFLLEVSDTGIGISAEALPHIFDRFYRQDKARTRQNGGHGLGLAIAKSMVNAARGSITASSAPGEGSTFTVRLPLPPGE